MTQNSGYEPSREPAGRQPEPQQPARNGYSHDDGGYAAPQGQEAPYQNGYDRGDGYRTGDDQQGYNQQQGGYDQQAYPNQQQPYPWVEDMQNDSCSCVGSPIQAFQYLDLLS